MISRVAINEEKKAAKRPVMALIINSKAIFSGYFKCS
jgi:hypothetical protein